MCRRESMFDCRMPIVKTMPMFDLCLKMFVDTTSTKTISQYLFCLSTTACTYNIHDLRNYSQVSLVEGWGSRARVYLVRIFSYCYCYFCYMLHNTYFCHIAQFLLMKGWWEINFFISFLNTYISSNILICTESSDGKQPMENNRFQRKYSFRGLMSLKQWHTK